MQLSESRANLSFEPRRVFEEKETRMTGLDIEQALQTLRLLHPESASELRVLGNGTPKACTPANDEEAVKFITDADAEQPKGIYVTLNPVPPGMSRFASDADILRRHWILIDLDPERPSECSSTDLEHAMAMAKAEKVFSWLKSQGFPECVVADSGNGYHLLLPVDLPNDDHSKELVKAFLQALKANWQDEHIGVDTKVANASRVTKLYGTVARKGESTADRPHRLSGLVYVPQDLANGWAEPTPRELIEQFVEKFAPQSPSTRPSQSVSQGEGDLRNVGQIPSVDASDKLSRCMAYVDKLPASISGQGGHDALLQAACETVRFDLNEAEAMVVLNHYNTRAVPPWDEKDLRRKLREAEKVAGRERGKRLQQSPQGIDIAFAPTAGTTVLSTPSAPSLPATQLDGGPFPSELLDAPGFVGEYARFLLDSAPKAMPEMALSTAISLMSLLLGNRVKDDTAHGTLANIYVLLVAPSGYGKDWGRSKNKRLLRKIEHPSASAPERIGSHAGLISWMVNCNPTLLQLDEIGHLMATMGVARNAHLFNISAVLMSLYSSAGTHWAGDAYADLTRVPEIDCPYLVVYGTTTPQALWSKLDAGSVSDGLMGRFLVFDSISEPITDYDRNPTELPQHIIDQAKWWLEFRGGFTTQRPTSAKTSPSAAP